MNDGLKSSFIEEEKLPNDGLAYTGEIIFNEQGIPHYVIDLDTTDFTDALPGRKKGSTLVHRAEGGEYTAQVFPSGNETNVNWPYRAVEGDAIFIQGNLEACLTFIKTGEPPKDLEGNLDIYVPNNAKLSSDGRLKFDNIEAEGYALHCVQNDSGTKIKVFSPAALILDSPNTQHVCIKSEKEGGQHKFFPPGAAFKLLDGQISGINPDSFRDTWDIIPGLDVNLHQAGPELESPD